MTFFMPSFGWYFLFNAMLKYLPIKKVQHSKSVRPKPHFNAKKVLFGSNSGNKQTNN